MASTLPRFYTVSEIAQVIRLSQPRVYEAVRTGLLPAVRIGRQVRIEERAFLDWVEAGGATLDGGWKHQPD